MPSASSAASTALPPWRGGRSTAPRRAGGGPSRSYASGNPSCLATAITAATLPCERDRAMSISSVSINDRPASVCVSASTAWRGRCETFARGRSQPVSASSGRSPHVGTPWIPARYGRCTDRLRPPTGWGWAVRVTRRSGVWGARSRLEPVTWGDAPARGRPHDGQLCPCACCT
jgi:hypothetical protein